MSTINEQHVMDVVRAINDLDLPDITVGVEFGYGKTQVNLHPWNADELRATRRAIGPCAKKPGPSGLVLEATQLGDFTTDNLRVRIFASSACTKVQVGTEVKPVLAETGETEEVPVYEWQCEGVLVDG